MGNNQTNFEIEDGESGEVTKINLTSLVSDVRDLFLSKIRNDKLKTIWSKMSEAQQQTEIDHADNLARSIVIGVAHIIASGKNSVIHATLDNYKVKGGEVTVTAKGFADDGAVLALNHVGKKALKIIVVDEEQYDSENRPAKADPDQFTIFNDQKQEDEGPSLAEAMQAAIDADEAGGETDKKEPEQPENPDPEAVPEKPDLTPFEQGKGAAEHGLDAKSNPFRKNSKNWLEWVKGFEEAQTPREPDGVPTEEEVLSSPDGDDDDFHNLEGEDDTDQSLIDDLRTDPEDEDGGLGDDEDDAPVAQGEIVDEADVPFAGEDPFQEGMAARAADEGPDANPYDGGTDGFLKWKEGYDSADEQLEAMKEAGRTARREGAGPKKNPWKEGTLEHRTWSAGYVEEKNKEGD